VVEKLELPLISVKPEIASDSEDFYRAELAQHDGLFQVALVHPFLAAASTKNRLMYRESLALGYLTSALELHGYPVDWINAELRRLSAAEVAARILENPRMRLVGISLKAQRALSTAADIANLLKKSDQGIHVTLGGLLPSSGGREILERYAMFDSCVKGEGEAAVVDLADALRRGRPMSSVRSLVYREGGEIVQTPERGRVKNLDMIPFPERRDLAYLAGNRLAGATNANMLATRGCYAACTFCSIHQIYGDRLVMRRSPANIVAEMKDLVERYEVKRITFFDDIFIHPSRSGIAWAYELADRIMEADLGVKFYAEIRADTVEERLMRRLNNAGLYKMFIGMESGVDSVLKRLDKGCTVADNENALKVLTSDIGMNPNQIHFGYIMFEPDMTFEELRQQYTWLRHSGYATVQNLQNRLNVYWGTPQYVKMKAAGRLSKIRDLGDRWGYEFTDPLVAAFEHAFRQFHRWFTQECLDEIQPNREVFFEKISEEILAVPADPRVADIISQTRDRNHALERDAYFDAFDTLFDLVRLNGSIPDDALSRLQAAAEAVIVRLRIESRLLRLFAERLESFETVSSADQARPGVAWPIESGLRWVAWVADDTGLGINGVVANTNFTREDRYAHACVPVMIRRDAAQIVIRLADGSGGAGQDVVAA
jgi:radical SAM superfamily enzyme YgiQ (UPF0313 family)